MKEGVKMNTIIVYYSKHHGNTKKLVDAIKEKYGITAVDILNKEQAELEKADIIGIASGIYAGSFAKPLLKYLSKNLPEGKRVFFISTSAGPKPGYEKSIRALTDSRSCEYIGSYSCMGFNTFGPTKLFGGTAKGHPTDEEINGAVSFFSGLLQK